MDIYLIKINDRAWGFRVVAIPATSDDEAKEFATRLWRCQFENIQCHNFAEVVDSCEARPGHYAHLEYEE